MARRLLTGDAAEDGANRHPKTSQIPPQEYVSRHHLASGVHVRGRLTVGHHHARPFIHLEPEIRERDAWAQGIRPERCGIESLSPVRLLWIQSLRTTIVEPTEVECPGTDCSVERIDG